MKSGLYRIEPNLQVEHIGAFDGNGAVMIIADGATVFANMYPADAEAKIEELKMAYDRQCTENSKLGIMYEQLLKEKSDLERKIGFLEGQIEAYQYCVGCR